MIALNTMVQRIRILEYLPFSLETHKYGFLESRWNLE